MTEEKKIKIRIDDQDESADSRDGDPSVESRNEKQEGQTEGDEYPTEVPIEDLNKRLESAEKEAKETYDRFLRVSAEFENYKKRSAREMADFRKFANQSFIKDLLSVVDNLERAVASCEDNSKDEESLLAGVELILKELFKLLEKYQVEPISALGEPFDPAFHEAVMQEPSADYPDNTVTKELQRGYLIHERLLRPAMVVVSAPGTPAQPDDNHAGDDTDDSGRSGKDRE